MNRPAASVVRRAAGNRFIADVAQATDYDAYGSWRFGRSSMMTESYRYMWHGMRRPDGLSDPHMYITPFRLYDVRLGRWNTRDPIFDPSVSPYEGMGSNPISLTDLWGLNPGGGNGSGESTSIMPAKKQPSGSRATGSSVAGAIPTSGRAPDIEGVASYYTRGATVVAEGVATLELTEQQREREWAEGERYYAGPMGEFNYHKGAFWPHEDYVAAVNNLRKALTWMVPESMSNEDISTYSQIDPSWLGFDLENTSPDFHQILADLTPNPALVSSEEVLITIVQPELWALRLGIKRMVSAAAAASAAKGGQTIIGEGMKRVSMEARLFQKVCQWRYVYHNVRRISHGQNHIRLRVV